MARKSDTREKVRLIADDLASQGIVPSSRKILELLGNKGSLTTITDELSLWEKGGRPDSPTEKEVEPPVPPSSPKPTLLSPLLEVMATQMSQMVANSEKTTQELEAIRKELVDLKKTHAEQLATSYERYEAVQRHALMQVDEARQNTAQLRDRVKTLTLELDTREMAHSGKLQAVREENARLRGKLEALGMNAEGASLR